MRWATRRHCHIDRAACAWLIRRFIDPQAEFLFVDDPDEVPDDATPFDMRGVELSHHDGDCSFETFLRRYEIPDPARLAAQASHCPPALPGRLPTGLRCVFDQRAILDGDRLGHPRGKLALLPRRTKFSDPDRRLPARIENLVGEPLQLLPVARIEG